MRAIMRQPALKRYVHAEKAADHILGRIVARNGVDRHADATAEAELH